MSTDLDKITAAEWWYEERLYRKSSGEMWRPPATRYAYGAGADYCAKMAEAAEGREKCQRGEHDKEDCGLETFHEYSIIMVKCRRCDWIAREANVNPAPPADVTREDVEYHLANWRGADTTSAVQRAMIRRVFADVLEGK